MLLIEPRDLALDVGLPPCDERIAELYGYWQSIHPAKGRLPGRQHFDPVDVPQLLPWIWLIEFQRHPLRLKYRLAGTEHVLALGRDPTGYWLDEVHPRFAMSSGYPQFVAAIARAEIGFHKGSAVYYQGRERKRVERLILPLARNGRDVDMLLGLTVFMPPASGNSPQSPGRVVAVLS